MSKIGKVIVPQGIGDIIWAYRKLAPHYDALEIDIAYFKNEIQQDIQRRSENIIKLLPKVTTVKMRNVTKEHYNELAHNDYPLSNLLNNIKDVHMDYSVNGLLDRGVNLEDLDEHPVEWEFSIATEPLPIDCKYILMYISGSTEKRSQAPNLKHVYTVEEWAKLAKAYKQKFPEHRLFLIGATFDRNIMGQVASLVENCELIVQPEPKKLMWLLDNAEFFLGYQSGLNILADHFDTPQLMFYFDVIKDMKDAWVKPKNKDSFKYCYFSDGIEIALQAVKDI